MLEFKLNNRPLLLDESASVRITRTNPACFMDSMPGDIALGISIPVNDNTRAEFGNPERFEKYSNATSREFPGFEIRFSGVLLALGTVIIQSANKDTYSGWLRSELGNFGKVQREKKLPDMPWPETQNMEHKPAYDDDTDDYGFQWIFNPGFWDGIGREETTETTVRDENNKWVTREETRSVLQNAHWKNYFYAVNPQVSAPLWPIKEGAVVTPFLHLKYVIKESLRMNKWFVKRNDMLIPGMLFANFTKNAMIFNNFNIIDMVLAVYPEYIYTWDPETNEYSALEVGKITNVSWQLKPFNYADLLPRVSMKDFLLGIQNSLNYIFFFKTDSTVDIIDRNSILTSPSIDIAKYIVGDFSPGEQKNVRLKFKPEYDKDDKLFGSGFEDLSERWADFKEPVNTLLLLNDIAEPEFGELRLVLDQNGIYEYTWVVIEQENINRQEEQIDTIGWKFVSSGPQPYIYGAADEEEEIKTSVSTLRGMTGILGAFQLQANQRGNLATMRRAYSDFSLRIFSSGLTIPRFSWEGPAGLFETRWKNWARFWKTRLPVEAEFNFPLNALSFVADNIFSKFNTEKGEFVIEEMETTFGLDSIGTTKIKGYKV
jgi:hypothetical protein